ncbi:hypothetical protein J437_LFUL004569 [Ladona fulva]|uniref:EKC/KEOPS complex subunit TPRKB n=1 Tax=Ladona fulva TaxID=123851 RepID=A0A8K0JU65_LADFU|nr:hypothetical protein J437_LFUL004569 [Ladona fulva]
MTPEEFELDKSTNSFVQIALFRNVQNTKELKAMLLSGQLECSMINPALILAPFQIVIAVNKAVLSENQKKLTTRNVFTEVLYNLSASKNITQSLKRFGINEDDKSLVVVAIRKNEISSLDRVLPLISGDQCPIGEIKSLTDITLIQKTYNVKDEELKASQLLDSIVSRISAKDIFTFKM